jgi:TolB protein
MTRHFAVLCIPAFIFAIIFLTPSPGECAGDDYIIISKGAVKKTLVAVPDMTVNGRVQSTQLSKELSDAFRFDLDNSGWFTTVKDYAKVRQAQFKDPGPGSINRDVWRANTDAEVVAKADLKQAGNSLTVSCRIFDIVGREGKLLFEKAFTLETKDPRFLVHYLSDQIVKELTGRDGIARTKIAFVASRGTRDKHLYLMDYDGHNVRRISNFKEIKGNMIVVAPDWAPNGKAVYFTSYHLGYPYVFKIDLEAWRLTAVSTFPGLNASAAISPNGSEMALCLSKTGSVEIHKKGVMSKKTKRLTYAGRSVAAVPRWSPDGGKIAYVSGELGVPQIFVMSSSGSNKRRLIRGYSHTTSLDWSPRGDLIAFSATQNRRVQLFVADIERNQVKQLTFDNANNSHPSFAPDGIHIMYTKEKNYSSNLHIVDVRDGKDVRITDWEGDETYPSWSPLSFMNPL